MMKLRYLFDNRELAIMLLDNWRYDKENISFLDGFRISANAVYPFTVDGKVHFLRFAPVDEKSEANLLAELNFIAYLSSNGYSAVKITQTRHQKEHVRATTPWGDYLAVVFEGVEGKPIGQLSYSEELYYGYGKALGQMHKLSQDMEPSRAARPDWRERLLWIKETLLEYAAPNNAMIEVDILLDFLTDINADKSNYGLIHYDFELDNVFYDEAAKKFNIIDFDDSVYHWFAMDIEQSLDSIEEEIPAEFHEEAKKSFLSGYTSEMNLSEDMKKLFPVFRRYANVFGYARCLRSLHETWHNEPEWMSGLRKHVQDLMAKRQKEFGLKIQL